jgi:FkbM family methyltransferase
MKLLTRFGHDYVSSANLHNEKEIKKIFKPKPKNIVIDVGAYIGYYTIKAAKMVGQGGLVIAIEPNPLSYELLKKNLELNKITYVKIINKVLYSSEGKIAFVCKSAGASSSYVYDIRKVLENDGKIIFVEALTLDRVINKFEIKHVDWLKIDAEGSEVEILKGANETLKITNNIIIECRPKNYYIIKSILTKFGFKYKSLGIYHSNVFYLYAYKN